MNTFTHFLNEAEEKEINKFRSYINYIVNIIVNIVKKANKLQVASTDYFIEGEVVAFSTYRIIFSKALETVSSLNFDNIEDSALDLIKSAISVYNNDLPESFSNLEYNFPKATEYAKDNPQNIKESFLKMLSEAQEIFKNKPKIVGDVGESQIESLLKSLGYKRKTGVSFIQSTRQEVAGKNLERGEYISSISHKVAPDFVVCVKENEEDKLKKVFPNISIFNINKKPFTFIEVKTTIAKDSTIGGSVTSDNTVHEIFKRVEEKGKIKLTNQEIRLLKTKFNTDIDYVMISTTGIQTKTFPNIKMKQTDTITLEKAPAKTKQRYYEVKKGNILLFKVEKRTISRSLLSKENKESIKKVWKLFRKVWYGNSDKKTTDELRAAYAYYLIHTEQEIPAHIVKNSYELKIEMDKLRDKIFNFYVRGKIKPKQDLFNLLEKILYDKKELILFEGFEELCLRLISKPKQKPIN